jgi:ABC-type amino acid transport substrate-binding protein
VNKKVYDLVAQKGDPKGLLRIINVGPKYVKASCEYAKIRTKWIGSTAK